MLDERDAPMTAIDLGRRIGASVPVSGFILLYKVCTEGLSVLTFHEDVLHFVAMTRPSAGRIAAISLAMAISIVLFVALRFRSGEAHQSQPSLPGTSTGPVAFVDVTVIPMDGNRLLPNHTVVVRDGRIVSVEPTASASVPSDAMRIDGRGKFLMPGLAEMHAHVLGPQAANSEALIRDIMFLYVANGITTIRAMLGAPNQLVLRDQLKSDEVLGPTMYVAAPPSMAKVRRCCGCRAPRAPRTRLRVTTCSRFTRALLVSRMMHGQIRASSASRGAVTFGSDPG